MRASSASYLARVHVGAATDTTESIDALAGIGAALPMFALGAVGAVFGGTLWGLYGLLGGALAGAGAGYGVTKLASKPASDVGGGSGKDPSSEPTAPDFGLPVPSKFKALPGLPIPGDIPKLPFPDEPTFVPTPGFWIPVSTVNSRSRVDMHRDLRKGSEILFIAQIVGPVRDPNDTTDMIKMAGEIVLARTAMTDQDPAYGVVVTRIVEEHDIHDGVPRPSAGLKVAVSPDQVLESSVGTKATGFTRTGAHSNTIRAVPRREVVQPVHERQEVNPRMPHWLRRHA